MENKIQTKSLLLVPFSESFLSTAYVNWLNDPEVVRFSEQRHKSHTMETCRSYFSALKSSPHHFWAIVTQEGSKHIGNIQATVDANNKLADISILLGEKSQWGKGYGLEAWDAVCIFCFEQLGTRKITAGTMAENKAMLSIMKKSGMREEGIRKRHYLLEAREVDVVLMCRFKLPEDV